MGGSPLLRLKGVTAAIGKFRIIHGVSLEIEKGECVALLGSNGAGKTTLFRTIAGLLKPQEGTVEFKGVPIQQHSPDRIVALGLSLCPEGRHLFPQLPVLKNLLLGAYVRRGEPARVKRSFERVYDLFPILKERRNQLAGTLSGGEQQMLAIARALMSEPEMLLLDEPSMGLAPLVVRRIGEVIKAVNEEGTTVFLSEQNASMALKIASRGYVLESGRIVLEGPGTALVDNAMVKKAYLGA